MEINKSFVHHVYFWLNNPESKEDLEKLIAGLQALSKVSEIASFHIGIPAPTNREVIDSSYAVSWLNIFNSEEDEKIYQSHPMHLKFIEDCSSLWRKVIVYDSIHV
jgi:hypothetical protein